MEEELFDKRIIERNVKKGVFPRKDYHEYLKKLPDMSGNVIIVEEPREEPKGKEKSKKK